MPDELKEYELNLHKQWKKTKDPEILSKLVKSLEPIMYKSISKWRGGALPDEVLYAQGLKYLYKGIQTFDPSKGVKLSTHVMNQLMPIARISYTYSNAARIPENRIQRLALFKNAVDVLTDKYGRRPSVDELADYLSWSKKLVSQTYRDLFKDTLLQEGYMHVPVEQSTPYTWAIDFFYHSLKPEEKLIFEDLTGYGGRPKLPESEVLKKHKLSREQFEEFRNRVKRELGTLLQLR